MTKSCRVPILAVLTLAACSGEVPTGVEPATVLSAARSGGSTVYAYTMTGDIDSVGDAPTAGAKAGSPFARFSLSDFSLTLEAPTGDVAACRTGSGTYTTTFGANAGPVWVGTLKTGNSGTLSFLGSNADGETIQFSLADATGGPTQGESEAPGSYTYSYTDARLYFGSNSTHYDGLYRCVNVTLTATP